MTPDPSNPGVPCPNCGAPIAITLNALLNQASFKCSDPACKTVLRLDTRQSKEALNAAAKLKAGLEKADEIKPDGAR